MIKRIYVDMTADLFHYGHVNFLKQASEIGDYLIVEQSKMAKDYNENDIKEYMKWDSINIEVNLNIGNSSHTVYTCDMTHEYIDINTDYRN